MNAEDSNDQKTVAATSTSSGISRRSFIKRTSGAILVSTLALNAFRNEVKGGLKPAENESTAESCSFKRYPVYAGGAACDAYESAGEPHHTMSDEWADISGPVLTWHRLKLQLYLVEIDPPQDEASGSRTGVFRVYVVHEKTTDALGETGWSAEGVIDETVSVTTTNEAYRKEGDVTFESDGVGVLTEGGITAGVQIRFNTDPPEAPRSVHCLVRVRAGLGNGSTLIDADEKDVALPPSANPPQWDDPDPVRCDVMDEIMIDFDEIEECEDHERA